MRQKVRRTVICCPPSVVRQWKDEMEQRFGLTFVIYDRDYVTAKRQERGYGVNPWTTHSRFIISQALIRNETYAGPLRNWLEEVQGGSMFILEEAHNAAPASASKYAIDSKLTKAIRELTPRFVHKLFLSATPHNGHSNSFSAILEMLDPQKFCRGVPVHHTSRDAVMIRRLKHDLREIGEEFPERKIIRIDIEGLPEDAPELVLSHLLERYRQARKTRLANATTSQGRSSMLVAISLQKRLLSSIEAFARTLDVHSRAVKQRAEAASATPVPGVRTETWSLLVSPVDSDDERAALAEEEVAEDDAQMTMATAASVGPAHAMGPELKLLDDMGRIANQARYEPDSRVRLLVAWVKKNLCPNLGMEGARWNNRRVLIFIEYTDTKRALVQQLQAAIAGSDQDHDRILTFHGGIGEERREAIKAAFNADPDRHPLRILVATDAAREGVNLQNHCADLFHFDIPWNPSRMEQRNGRIDRMLQRSPEVRCHYFVVHQRAEDRVLGVLVKKSEVIHEELGSLAPVVATRVTTMFSKGIQHEQVADLYRTLDRIDDDVQSSAAGKAVHEDLEEVLERKGTLAAQVERLEHMLKDSRDWMGLDDRHFRDALSASLEILGAESLQPLSDAEAAKDPSTARWVIPRLHERMGADHTWAYTLDALRAPMKKGQKRWQWRKEAPIRPVVFRDPETLDNEVVHLHLEHRVVQRLLGRFLAQGFLHDELTRACVLRTDDPVPRVVAFGRLSLYGEGASRLHDEILAVAAEWQDPTTRGRGKLKPVGEGVKSETLKLLDDALAQPRLREAPDGVRRRLEAHASQDVRELYAHLERRAERISGQAERALTTRGEQEAKEMQRILEAQRDRIERQHEKTAENTQQRTLGFSRDEERQLAANQKHWAARLLALADEIQDEPARIRAGYAVQASRVEPVGLVYLWPVSG